MLTAPGRSTALEEVYATPTSEQKGRFNTLQQVAKAVGPHSLHHRLVPRDAGT